MSIASSVDDEVPRLADLIVKAGQVYAMDEGRSTFRSFAVRDGRVVAVSGERDGLDALATSQTGVLDDAGLIVLPAFFDTHEHLLDSARNLGRVRAEDARSIDQLVAMIRERALRTPEGEWVQTSSGWNESNLAPAPPDDLPGLEPVLTCVGGLAAHDPDNLIPAADRLKDPVRMAPG